MQQVCKHFSLLFKYIAHNVVACRLKPSVNQLSKQKKTTIMLKFILHGVVIIRNLPLHDNFYSWSIIGLLYYTTEHQNFNLLYIHLKGDRIPLP